VRASATTTPPWRTNFSMPAAAARDSIKEKERYKTS
jgi:hypothetical protein